MPAAKQRSFRLTDLDMAMLQYLRDQHGSDATHAVRLALRAAIRAVDPGALKRIEQAVKGKGNGKAEVGQSGD